jgi:diamine N-acetyltransferase
MAISKITPADLAILLPFSEKIFHDTFFHQNKKENYDNYVNRAFTLNQFQKEMDDVASHFFWIVEDEAPKAWLKLNEQAAFSEKIKGNGIEIQRIYVDTDAQGRGYGKILLDYTDYVAFEMKKEFIWLGVWEHNKAAIKFYEKNGYKIVSSHDFTFGDEVQTDFIMEKKL